MKKSSFVAMILSTIGGILFALGMCMALIPEWNAFRPGVVMGVSGVVVLLIMVLVWRKMEKKSPIRLSGKTIGTVLLGIVGALTPGSGHVSDYGVEQYDSGNCDRNCGNCSASVPDSSGKRIQIIKRSRGYSVPIKQAGTAGALFSITTGPGLNFNNSETKEKHCRNTAKVSSEGKTGMEEEKGLRGLPFMQPRPILFCKIVLLL